MNWKACRKKHSSFNFSYSPNTDIKKMRKIIKHLNQEGWSPGQDMNVGPPRHDAAMPPIQPQSLMVGFWENSNELFGSIKRKKFLDKLSDH
jgi:hypothetical protein